MRELASEKHALLALGPLDPFDPYALFEEHGIPIYSVDDLREFALGSADHFTDAGLWSAALVPLGSARIIIEDETHARVRRRQHRGRARPPPAGACVRLFSGEPVNEVVFVFLSGRGDCGRAYDKPCW